MKNIVIIATGGTIAGVGESGKNTGYESGKISATDLIASVPGLTSIANVTTEQFCNVNSDDITGEIWLGLARRVNELCKSCNVDGVVITHGTDTMEETAFFLALTVKSTKPVILTGAMRPATAAKPDGPANLLGAVKAAVGVATKTGACEGCNNSVKVFFGGILFDALQVQKCSASDLQPFGNAFPGDCSTGNSKAFPFFDVSNVSKLPNVNVVYFAVDSDPSILEYAAKVSDGLVIAGAGSGEFSLKFAETLKNIKIPVVVSTRINHGYVTLNSDLAPGRISAGELPPQKTAVLLRIAMATGKNLNQLF